jgi:Ion transport protein
MQQVLEHPFFEMFIVAVIILSSVQLALDTPILDPHSFEKKVLEYIDFATISVFTLECVAKILTYGLLINGHESYLRNIWNILDFCILIFSYLCLTSLVDTFKFVKTFRILRSLRIISRNEGLKVAVRALLYATPNIMSIAVIMILFFMIFAVILISYFKGKMYYCSSEIPTIQMLITKWDCLNSGGIWRSRTFNFDNMANALVTLFSMSTTAGWGEMMIFTITSVD